MGLCDNADGVDIYTGVGIAGCTGNLLPSWLLSTGDGDAQMLFSSA